MGFFSMFSSNKNSEILQLMKDYLSEFMCKYASKHPDDMPYVAGIFANTRMMINSMSPRDANKAMSKNGVSAECGVLNILQNYSMPEFTSDSVDDLLFGDNEGKEEAFDLYMFINEEKLRLGYISKEQYEENRILGLCLKTGQKPYF